MNHADQTIASTVDARPSRKLIGGLLAFVAAGGTAGMLIFGMPTADASSPAASPAGAPANAKTTAATAPVANSATSAEPAAAASAGAEQPNPEVMVARLAERMKTNPDINGLQMLGRAYIVMGRDAEAVAAYRKALELTPKNDATARSLAYSDLARAIGQANGEQVNAEVENLLKEALKLDQKNVFAHALLGKVAMDRGQTKDARQHWEQALAYIDPRHPFAEQLRSALVAAGGTPPTAAAPQPTVKQ